MKQKTLVCWLSLAICFALTANLNGGEADPEVFFETRIRPVLMEHCASCHGESKTESDLRVDHLAHLTKGGLSGPAIVPGKPDESLLMQVITNQSDNISAMPPDETLDQTAINDLREWIARGARWPNARPLIAEDESVPAASHWAFQPVKVSQEGPTRIDDFIAGKHDEKSVTFAPRADKITLIRRATFDLTGLPPTPAEVDQFVGDRSPDAFSRLVDRLLESPEYGRRYGRHWLDLVRYADTGGDNSDYPIPEMGLYRDYVIDAMNDDMPYDQFLREQLAGDRLAQQSTNAEDYRRQMIATTFIASARRFGDDLNPQDVPHVIGDTVATVGQSMLGVTLECARCHDHKFDPISTEDYYGFYGYFESSRWPTPGREGRPYPMNFVSLSRAPDAVKAVQAVNDRAWAYRKENNRVKGDAGAYLKLQRQIFELDEAIAHSKSDGGPDDSLLQEREKLVVQRDQLDSEQLNEYLELIDELQRIRDEIGVAYGVVDAEETGDSRIQLRGQHNRLGEVAPRAFLSAIADDQTPQIPAGESGRYQLAQWIASAKNPLTARVFVNRLWNWHFGRGLVNTPSNFGLQGERPSHPELLDFLANEFIQGGWSVKQMHRLMMNTRTYQQAYVPASAAPDQDTENRYYWRFDRRRLEAEAIRDTILQVSGQLDPATPGPHPFPSLHQRSYSQHHPYESTIEHHFRSVYLVSTRIRKNRFLSLFDGADPVASTETRRASTVPLQSLYLMNNQEINQNAMALAGRLIRGASQPEARLEMAYRLAYSRRPEPSETENLLFLVNSVARKLRLMGIEESEIEKQAWTALAHALLMSNELSYIN